MGFFAGAAAAGTGEAMASDEDAAVLEEAAAEDEDVGPLQLLKTFALSVEVICMPAALAALRASAAATAETGVEAEAEVEEDDDDDDADGDDPAPVVTCVALFGDGEGEGDGDEFRAAACLASRSFNNCFSRSSSANFAADDDGWTACGVGRLDRC